MVDSIGRSENFSTRILTEILEIKKEANELVETRTIPSNETAVSFADHLSEGINSVNEMQITAGKLKTDLATGKSSNIHETMLASSYAGLTFKLMVQMRNKGLEAYNEIMRMPV